MKKIVVLVLCCCLLFSLTGCVGSSWDEIVSLYTLDYFYFEYDELVNNVEKAEIVNLNVNYSYGTKCDKIDETRVEILKTFDYDTTLELLYDLSQIEYNDGPIIGSQLPTFGGDCIRVWYLDGSYDIYDYGTTTVVWGQCNREDFNNLIAKYME